MLETTENKVNFRLKLGLIFIPIVLFSQFFHEFGHWSMGEILGYDMKFGFNLVGLKDGEFVGNSELFMTMGGTFATFFLALLFWFGIEKFKSIYLYPGIFYNFFFRLIAQFLNFEGQDEAKISAFLGIGKYTITIIVLGLLLLITWRASRVLKLNYKDNLVCVSASIVGVGFILIIDYLLILWFN